MDSRFAAGNEDLGMDLVFYSAGLINRTGVSYFTGMINPKIYTESKLFRRFDFQFYSGQLRVNIDDKWETNNSLAITSLLGASIRLNVK
jgi:hypothetical protein